MKPIRVQEICDFLIAEGYAQDLKVTKDLCIEGFSPISQTTPNTLSWMRDQKIDWSKIESVVIICSRSLEPPNNTGILFIPVQNPRLAFAKVLERFGVENEDPVISPTAKIGKNVTIGGSVSIGHYSVIGDHVSIGAYTIIHPNVSIYDHVSIGERCRIHSGTVIGSDGFGYEKDEDGILIKVPHIGGVVIEEDVEIGSNVSIDRGTIGNTLIQKNTKIDNLCHIAHNVNIGRNTTIIALSMIAGSVVIEDNCWVAPCSAIREGLVVGKESLIGLGAVVVKKVERGDVVVGVPAKSIKKKDRSKGP